MGAVVSFRTPRQKRMVAIHGHGRNGGRLIVVPPLSHADLDRKFGRFDAAVDAAVELARDNGWRIFDFTGRIDHAALLARVDQLGEAL